MENKVKCLVVDDEQLARDFVIEYLADFPQIEVVAQSGKASEAIQLIDSKKPDLLFLDVQMPGKDGFEVLEKINHEPFVIFCTAYDKYAIRAFENNAIDYLLKPLDKSRFDQAVSRAIKRIANNDKNFEKLIEEFTQQQIQSYTPNLFVQKKDKLINLPVQNIICLEASGDYTVISTQSDQFLSSSGISKLATRLDPAVFIRIHRSTIININRLQELEKHSNGTLSVVMENKKSYSVSRSYAKQIRDMIV
ncbi:MAG: response regulator transcription factor [Cyclobacteriaceae bacterium]|nr:response regulator transcription factor [Cyclobacteriaceae bacterium]